MPAASSPTSEVSGIAWSTARPRPTSHDNARPSGQDNQIVGMDGLVSHAVW